MYGLVPPVAVAFAVPLFETVSGVEVVETVIAVGSVIIALTVV